MPVYNSGEYLKKAVNSILSQGFTNFELILVDDGSTDGSSENCDIIAKSDSRVIVLHQSNKGICNARNAALSIAKGEYIAFSDHDDEYLPGLLENAYKTAIKYNADVVKFQKKELIILNGKTIRKKETHYELNIYHKEKIKDNLFLLLDSGVLICVWDGIYRKKIINNNKLIFDELFKYGGEDIDFMLRMVKYVEIIVTLPNFYYLHYIRRGFSTSTKYNIIQIKQLEELSNRVLETISALKINLNLAPKRKEYSYYIFKDIICPIINLYASGQCKIKYKEKISLIHSLRKASYLPNDFFTLNEFIFLKKSNRVGLAYILFKYKLYGFLLFIFYFQQKYQIK